MATVYGNAIDLANAKAALGDGFTFVDTSQGGKYTPGAGDIVVGGAGAIGGIADAGSALRLWGANKDETAKAISGYAASLPKQEEQKIVMPAYTPYNPTADIQALKQASIQATTAALDKAKAQSLSSLSTERQQIAPAYQQQKNAANIAAKRQARSFEDYMAQRGGGAAKSGIAAQGNLMNNVALQGNIGQLNTAEANALLGNTQRQTDTETAYQNDLAAAQAGANANAMQMQISANQQAAANELAYRQWLYEQQTAQDNNLFNRGVTLAGVTGYYNGKPTIDYSNMLYNQGYNNANLTGYMPDGTPTMSREQNTFNNKIKQAETETAQQKATQSNTNTDTTTDKAPTAAQQKVAQNKAIAWVDNLDAEGNTEEQILYLLNSQLQALADDGVDIAALRKYIIYDRYRQNIVDNAILKK